MNQRILPLLYTGKEMGGNKHILRTYARTHAHTHTHTHQRGRGKNGLKEEERKYNRKSGAGKYCKKH